MASIEKSTSPAEQLQKESRHAYMKSVDMPSLPSPASAAPAKPNNNSKTGGLSAAMIIPIWIAISSAVIIYNNYVYNTLNFRYPVFLVTFHLTFAVSSLRNNSILVFC
jgi:hypothetical protein